MSAHFYARKPLPEAGYEEAEGGTLGGGAGVGGSAAIGACAPCVGDADGVGVVAAAVGPDLRDGAPGMDGAVEADKEVIADGGKAALAVPSGDVGNGHVAPGGGGR